MITCVREDDFLTSSLWKRKPKQEHDDDVNFYLHVTKGKQTNDNKEDRKGIKIISKKKVR